MLPTGWVKGILAKTEWHFSLWRSDFSRKGLQLTLPGKGLGLRATILGINAGVCAKIDMHRGLNKEEIGDAPIEFLMKLHPKMTIMKKHSTHWLRIHHGYQPYCALEELILPKKNPQSPIHGRLIFDGIMFLEACPSSISWPCGG